MLYSEVIKIDFDKELEDLTAFLMLYEGNRKPTEEEIEKYEDKYPILKNIYQRAD